MRAEWPKGPTYWTEDDVMYISVPFTWNLPDVIALVTQQHFSIDRYIIGGPAIELMPDYFKGIDHVKIGHSMPGILQRVNPFATRTSIGCVRKCGFCGIGQGKIEAGGFHELNDWPDLPIICDNNLLAASQGHFDRVMDRLEKWDKPDFNQGLDSRLLNSYHARRLARLKRPNIRLACDSFGRFPEWLSAYHILINEGCKKSWISTYALIGFNDGPDGDWQRCERLSRYCVVYPMWYHPLDAIKANQVTLEQETLGWTNAERVRIMRRFYQAKRGGYVEAAP